MGLSAIGYTLVTAYLTSDEAGLPTIESVVASVQAVPETPAQAVHDYLRGSLGDSKTRRDVTIRRAGLLPREERTQLPELS